MAKRKDSIGKKLKIKNGYTREDKQKAIDFLSKHFENYPLAHLS
jgi:hypothetical protein